MKAQILNYNGSIEELTVNGSINKFLTKQFYDMRPIEVAFYKKAHGLTVEVAHAYFNEPRRIVLHYTRLTETEQRQFIGFVADHVTTSIYGSAFNIEMVER